MSSADKWDKKGLYKFHWDCGRMGDLEGVFIATGGEIETAIGKDIYFGDVLGKHSEIYGPLERKDVTNLIVCDAVIEAFEEHKLCVGYNPLDYIEEELNG